MSKNKNSKNVKKTKKAPRSPRNMKATKRTIALPRAIAATGTKRAKGFEKSPRPPILSGADAIAALKGKGKGKKQITDTIDAGGGIMVDVVETVGPEQKTEKPRTPKVDGKMSGLDAAYEVLKANGGPMTCKAIVDEMLAKELWTTNGRTPAATMYTAMLREIDNKPGESRFTKTGRGLFAAITKN
ncbi:MAG: winged helix-turn-helix domain-containing protein [Phycisphaerales bacterium]|nr:winged helix-turn-helix domain-containing protein [Phycisphaerales bacterium]